MGDAGLVAGGGSDIDTVALVLRVLWLLSTAVLAGSGVFRPTVTAIGRRTLATVWSAGVVATVAGVLSLLLVPISVPVTVVQLALALAVPVVLRWSKPAVALGFALTVLLLAEMALDHQGFEFLADTVYTVGAVLWLGAAMYTATVPRANWRPSAVRSGPVSLIASGVLVVVGFAQIFLSGLGLDRRLYDTWFGWVVVAITVLPLVALTVGLLVARVRSAGTRAWLRVGGVAGITVAFAAWSALPALPVPAPLPVPGVPVLTQVSLSGQQVPVLISPQRPGRNLVHLPASAGTGVLVGPDGNHLVPVTTRPGTEGSWAEITLPAGRGEVVIRRGAEQDTVGVDTGTASGPAGAVGTDGPECASAALGGLIAGTRTPLTECPADRLSAGDADALGRTVNFLAARAAPGIVIDADDSPRSQQAAGVVRAAALARHITVDSTSNPNDALIVLSGWTTAAGQLHTAAISQQRQPVYRYGLYLAPWLLTGSLVDLVPSSATPLRFDPRDQQALGYAVALRNAFAGETPSVSGFDQWSRARHEDGTGDAVQLYAAAQVDAMPMGEDSAGMAMSRNYPGQWVPNGTVIPISGPLS